MGSKKEEMLRLSVIPAILFFGLRSFALFRKLKLEIFHQSFGFFRLPDNQYLNLGSPMINVMVCQGRVIDCAFKYCGNRSTVSEKGRFSTALLNKIK